MKAWFVWVGDEWGDYVHGETASKAKAMFMTVWHGESEWVELRPLRFKELDDIPINKETLTKLGVLGFYPICDCELCMQCLTC